MYNNKKVSLLTGFKQIGLNGVDAFYTGDCYQFSPRLYWLCRSVTHTAWSASLLAVTSYPPPPLPLFSPVPACRRWQASHTIRPPWRLLSLPLWKSGKTNDSLAGHGTTRPPPWPAHCGGNRTAFGTALTHGAVRHSAMQHSTRYSTTYTEQYITIQGKVHNSTVQQNIAQSRVQYDTVHHNTFM